MPLIVAFSALWMMARAASQKASWMMTLHTSKGTCVKGRGEELNITCDNFSTTLFDLPIFKLRQHITLSPL